MQPQWVRLDTTISTNSWISERLKREGFRKELAVIADYQEYGRGMREKRWESLRGENLLMSLLLFPAFLSASQQFLLSKAISLSICDYLERTGIVSRIKWPNDIVTPGGKIAGILIEHGIIGSSLTHSIIGIGLNINQVQFPEFPVAATSVLMETGERREIAGVAEELVVSISRWYKILEQGRYEKIDSDYLQRLYGLRRLVGLEMPGRFLRGEIRGVNEIGELVVETNSGTMCFNQGEVSIRVNQ